jgi:hypothetical protein
MDGQNSWPNPQPQEAIEFCNTFDSLADETSQLAYAPIWAKNRLLHLTSDLSVRLIKQHRGVPRSAGTAEFNNLNTPDYLAS